VISPRTPVDRFAWPLDGDTHRPSTNVSPARQRCVTAAGAWGEHVLDVDEFYSETINLRRRMLDADPRRCAYLPHMRAAVWDSVAYLLAELAESHPDVMHLETDGSAMRWRNDLSGQCVEFTFGDESSLPVDPLRFVAEQVQEDVVLLDQRDGHLYVDAIASTFSGVWSNTFTLGMSFDEIHGPAPRIHDNGVVSRTERFLMGLRPGDDYRRVSWAIADGRFDMALEDYPQWAAGQWASIRERGAYGEAVVRIEVQHTIRLPSSDAVLFLIRAHMCALEEIATVPAWLSQLTAVVSELPPDLVHDKGYAEIRDDLVAWLRGRLAGGGVDGPGAQDVVERHDGAADQSGAVAVNGR
jgi:dimethylamine monooxygenase subunit A